MLLSLVRAARGHEIIVMAPGGGTLEVTLSQHHGIRYRPCEEIVVRHGRKGLVDIWHMLCFTWRFRRHLPLLRKQDVIYVNGLRHLPHVLLWSLTGLLPPTVRVIYHIHLDHSRLEKILLRAATWSGRTFRLIAVSAFVRDRLGFSSKKITLVENALDLSFVDLPFTDRFSGPACAAVVGTLRPEKGQDIAIAAVPADMDLHVIGPDGHGTVDWIPQLKRTAPANVHFDGPVVDIPRTLAQKAVQYNLVPSRWEEPFGLAAIEGMACSCLTIVSGRGGLAEIAAATGAMVAPNESALAQCLAGLEAMSRQARTDLARQQYDAVRTRYSPARFSAQMGAIFAAAARS